MTKKLFVVLIALLGMLSINAQAQDAKAKSILDKVSTKFKGYNSVKANFSLNITDAKGKSKGSRNGTFLLKGNKYRVNMPEQQIICDAKSIWTYLVDNQEVQITNFSANNQGISPAKLFSGSYSKEYASTYAGEKTIAGKKVDVIDMIPNNKSFKKLVLYVDKASSNITGGVMHDKNGGTFGYTISGIVPNAKVSDADFTWDTKKNPSIEVIDLR